MNIYFIIVLLTLDFQLALTKNIFYISVPQLGKEDVGFYGNFSSPSKTPFIDDFAKNSIIFDKFLLNSNRKDNVIDIQTGRCGNSSDYGIAQVFKNHSYIPAMIMISDECLKEEFAYFGYCSSYNQNNETLSTLKLIPNELDMNQTLDEEKIIEKYVEAYTDIILGLKSNEVDCKLFLFIVFPTFKNIQAVDKTFERIVLLSKAYNLLNDSLIFFASETTTTTNEAVAFLNQWNISNNRTDNHYNQTIRPTDVYDLLNYMINTTDQIINFDLFNNFFNEMNNSRSNTKCQSNTTVRSFETNKISSAGGFISIKNAHENSTAFLASQSIANNVGVFMGDKSNLNENKRINSLNSVINGEEQYDTSMKAMNFVDNHGKLSNSLNPLDISQQTRVLDTLPSAGAIFNPELAKIQFNGKFSKFYTTESNKNTFSSFSNKLFETRDPDAQIISVRNLNNDHTVDSIDMMDLQDKVMKRDSTNKPKAEAIVVNLANSDNGMNLNSHKLSLDLMKGNKFDKPIPIEFDEVKRPLFNGARNEISNFEEMKENFETYFHDLLGNLKNKMDSHWDGIHSTSNINNHPVNDDVSMIIEHKPFKSTIKPKVTVFETSINTYFIDDYLNKTKIFNNLTNENHSFINVKNISTDMDISNSSNSLPLNKLVITSSTTTTKSTSTTSTIKLNEEIYIVDDKQTNYNQTTFIQLKTTNSSMKIDENAEQNMSDSSANNYKEQNPIRKATIQRKTKYFENIYALTSSMLTIISGVMVVAMALVAVIAILTKKNTNQNSSIKEGKRKNPV